MANICFISPHPDDVELFCGGTLLHHINQGDQVAVVMLTKGELGSYNPLITGKRLQKIREKEAIRRYEGVKAKLIFADFYDKAIKNSAADIEKIHSILKGLQPDIIYTPEYDVVLSQWKHPDHINGTKITLAAARQISNKILIRCYHSKAITRLINIDPYFHENQRALRNYRSQYSINIFFFLHFMELRQKFRLRKLGRELGCLYAEGFREFYNSDESNELT